MNPVSTSWWRHNRSRIPLLALGVALGTAVAGTVSFVAAQSGPSQVIRACVGQTFIDGIVGGNVRILSPGEN